MRERIKATKSLFVLLLIIINGGSNAYLQNIPQLTQPQNIAENNNLFFLENIYIQKRYKIPEDKKREGSFLSWINTDVYAATIEATEERRRLRKKWEKMLGIDIFFPYFKAKEVESWIKEKAKIEFFNIKGKPEFKKDQIQYIFKMKF